MKMRGSRESIEEYLALGRNGSVNSQLVLLEKHRKELLNAVHENEKKSTVWII